MPNSAARHSYLSNYNVDFYGKILFAGNSVKRRIVWHYKEEILQDYAITHVLQEDVGYQVIGHVVTLIEEVDDIPFVEVDNENLKVLDWTDDEIYLGVV